MGRPAAKPHVCTGTDRDKGYERLYALSCSHAHDELHASVLLRLQKDLHTVSPSRLRLSLCLRVYTVCTVVSGVSSVK
jgi:hypothetical protein